MTKNSGKIFARTDDNLVEYYRRRAGEYEEIYDWRDPDRQRELDMLSTGIRDSLRGRDVEGFSENNVMHKKCFWYVDYVL